MDRNLIIKSLKHCASPDGCATCPQREGGKKCEMNLRVTVALLEELIEENDKLRTFNKLYESDIADRDKMLEQKVEDVYADFMRDYKAMREELDGTYEELAELRAERDELRERLKPKEE